MQTRTATRDDIDDVLQVLDAAALETDRELARESVASGCAVVAVEERRLLGAAVCVPAESGVRIEAIAVRKRRQAQGIGTALVEALLNRNDRAVAEFGDRVRPFYESLGFEIEPVTAERYRGVWIVE
ncbi:GNAT family N-acetyltransferase [Halapricum salinum]|uniref:N-acetyltransferase n=1 Tax=Halapricum salinum TaxID=1457250 RepID=A0A4D6HAT4_9EURY|nr:GNAT family N-acetyltransferase [Halapricum salinum]QCC50755.1 N-acetyltransferase [Halapricum salinum]